MNITVSGAYGREYKKGSEALADFLAGKDFIIRSVTYHGAYCSVRDFAETDIIEIRFNNDRSVVTYCITGSEK